MAFSTKKHKVILRILITLCAGGFIAVFFTAFSLDSVFLMEYKRSDFLLGTNCEVKIFTSPLKGNRVLDEIFSELELIHKKMSSEIPGNDVDNINQKAGKEWVTVSEQTFSVIEEGLRIAELTDGALDISLGPIIKLWNIGKDHEKLPSPGEIKKQLEFVNYRNIALDKGFFRVRLIKEGMKIDLGGIAKGYAADRVAAIIRNQGIKSALINLGGNIYVVGNHPKKRKWKIGILHPRPDNASTIIAFIDAADKTLVTSGDYERFFISDDKRYHHLIDPVTGYPSRNSLVSVTVIGPSSMTADGLTTGSFVLGLKKGRALLESLPGYEGVFVTRDKEIYITSGLKDIISLYVDDYEFIY